MTKRLKKLGDSLSPSRLSKGLKDPLRRTRSTKTKSSSVVEGLTPPQQTGVIGINTENFQLLMVLMLKIFWALLLYELYVLIKFPFLFILQFD